MLKKKTYFLRKNFNFKKPDIYHKDIKINLFNLSRIYFIHSGILLVEKNFFIFDVGESFNKYVLTKKPFSPPIHKILKKKK